MRLARPIVRGSIDHELAVSALGANAGSVVDGQLRRINGRYLKVAYFARDDAGRLILRDHELVVRWKRYRIPKNHLWRAKRPF